jgi:hypothetical protein
MLRIAVAVFGVSAFTALLVSAATSAPGPFSPFIGSWNGDGQVRLQDGRGEQIKCKAYFTDRAPGMGLALRCASSGSKIDLRAQLVSDGQRVSGAWEERQFNAAGSISGTQSGGKLSLTLDGGGMKATVLVTAAGAAQSVVISTDAGTVRGAQISLVKVADQ